MKLLFALLAIAAAAQDGPALRGVVTDPSGAAVPEAQVQLRGPGGEHRARTGADGAYSMTGLRPGRYSIRFFARGFAVAERRGLEIPGPVVLNVRLTIGTEAQVINIEGQANRVDTDPDNNGSALLLRERELAALSDDPDELAAQLQAMAGPGAGPNGGQIYIDGFTGGMLPSKSSIREVRINSNPFAPEYEKPGFGRIEIFTKPGMDSWHGMVFGQYSKEALNSRSPLLASSQRPPYKLYFAAGSISGPVVRKKASVGFDFHERNTTENAFVLATVPDADFQPSTVNQAVLTPQHVTTLTPRFDYAISPRNNLTIRNQYSRIRNENQGVGGFNLPSRAYHTSATENALQITETAVISPRFLTETRFQFLRAESRIEDRNPAPAILVQGAFSGGGSQSGNGGSLANREEFGSTSTWMRSAHTLKWGGRLRDVTFDSTSAANFGGTFVFLGAPGMTAFERYQTTLEYGQAAGRASQFTLNTGTPLTSVRQFDAGLFVNDDWRPLRNLTLSLGLRWEAQTNIGDPAALAPRAGIAWGIGKTVIRAGAGAFFDRVPETVTLNAHRFDGVTQSSYFVADPSFFPDVPPPSLLAAARLPQTVQLLDHHLRAPTLWQTSIGADRQVTREFRVSANYVESRGYALLRSRNINTPIGSLFPYGDATLRLLTEATGFSRSRMLQLTPALTHRRIMLFGYYALSYGSTDAEGQPADPYRLRDEWGPSTFAGVRHRLVTGANIPLPLQFSVAPFLTAASGTPYNITTGRDTNRDGTAAERPSLLRALPPDVCAGNNLLYAAPFGCFDLQPAPGTSIGRNVAAGPATFNVNLRLSRTWTLFGKDQAAAANAALQGAAAAVHGGSGMLPVVPAGMSGLHGAASGPLNRWTLTFTVSAANLLNRANYAPPSGDLSSPYFGVYRALAGGATTFNRKIDLQLRLTF